MKTWTIILVAILVLSSVACTNQSKEASRFIEVTGNADREIMPDEIHFMIRISEYWKEEFEHKKEKYYKTKISIDEIETKLLNDLAKIGIDKKDIAVRYVGNYWRDEGLEFLVSKDLDIVVHEYSKTNEIIKVVDKKGIRSMYIGKLDCKQMAEYRKQIKVEAIKSAKYKAENLLSGIGKKVGEVISVQEINNNSYQYPEVACMVAENVSFDNYITNFRKIKLNYKICAKFEIK